MGDELSSRGGVPPPRTPPGACGGPTPAAGTAGADRQYHTPYSSTAHTHTRSHPEGGGGEGGGGGKGDSGESDSSEDGGEGGGESGGSASAPLALLWVAGAGGCAVGGCFMAVVRPASALAVPMRPSSAALWSKR